MTGRVLTAALCVSLSGHALAQNFTLETTLAGGGTTRGVMFDITCLEPAGIYLNKFKSGCSFTSGVFVQVWTRSGTFVGHETAPDGWTLTAYSSSWCQGPNVLSFIAPMSFLPLPFNQTMGVYIEVTGGSPELSYTPIPPAAPQYADSHVRISGGAAKVGDGFSAPVIPLSMWNGGIAYNVGSPGCYANCDDSTTAPVLTPNDFQCFLNGVGHAQDSYSNCDHSIAAPMITANDFMCFLNTYATGCSAP